MKDLYEKQLTLKAQIAKLSYELTTVNEQITSLSAHKAEGSKTEEVDGYKTTITNVMNRTMSNKTFDAWVKSGGSVPEEYKGLIEYKPSLNKQVLKRIEMDGSQFLNEIAKFVTTKPGKSQVKIEKVEG